METAKDKTGKLYLLCDYNRDGDSYRSPWNNVYEPPLPDGFMPSDRLRQIEERMNIVFDSYRALYYEGGISSVYLWDLEADDGSFAACFLIKKEILEPQRRVSQGNWDSIHVVQVVPLAGQKKAACMFAIEQKHFTRKSRLTRCCLMNRYGHFDGHADDDDGEGQRW